MSELEIQVAAGVDTAGGAKTAGRGRVSVVEVIAALLAALLITAAIAPGLLAPGDPLAIDPLAAFGAPSWTHWFGTDESGRDWAAPCSTPSPCGTCRW